MKAVLRLFLIGALLLAACGGEQAEQSAGGLQTATPLDDQARLGTAQAHSAQAAQPSPSTAATLTPSPPPYDPGPYFTPRRPSPSDPATFIAPETVGTFSRYQLRGNCQTPEGQSSAYSDPDYQTIQLTCLLLPSLEAAQGYLQDLTVSASLSEPPLLFRLQGEASFLLGASGQGFIYAWTHGLWVFVARSPQGRAPLDDFMASFPH